MTKEFEKYILKEYQAYGKGFTFGKSDLHIKYLKNVRKNNIL